MVILASDPVTLSGWEVFGVAVSLFHSAEVLGVGVGVIFFFLGAWVHLYPGVRLRARPSSINIGRQLRGQNAKNATSIGDSLLLSLASCALTVSRTTWTVEDSSSMTASGGLAMRYLFEMVAGDLVIDRRSIPRQKRFLFLHVLQVRLPCPWSFSSRVPKCPSSFSRTLLPCRLFCEPTHSATQTMQQAEQRGPR